MDMHSLENADVCLRVSEDGSAVAVVDRARGTEWGIVPSSRRVRLAGETSDCPLPAGEVSRRDGAVVASHGSGDHRVEYEWRLHRDCVEVSVRAGAGVAEVALPGAFSPVEGGDWEIAVPSYQGCLIRRSREPWGTETGRGGHGGFSMAMVGVLGERSSLLVAHESSANWRARYGEDAQGLYAYFVHQPCPVDGWKGAAVRTYPADRGLTSVCRRYRRVVQARGEWRSWAEKIERKPSLKNLFGALMAFVGYNRTDEIDYLASARALKAYGFDRVFYFPLRMCHYSLDFRMGGDEPTWHTDRALADLHDIGGVFLGPWAWTVEGIDDGSERMDAIFRERDGERVGGWTMDDNRWFRVCPAYQIAHMKERLATDMEEMDWLHFDVNASIPPSPCTSGRHALHGNRPIGSLEDVELNRQLMSPGTVGDRVVSSEGFSDAFCCEYDIGTTKLMPVQDGDGSKMPVPMTMLVFHDCCVHDWWELQNYNALAEWPLWKTPIGTGIHGTGLPRLKAAIDALYACPPNLFPFGKQYGWVDNPGGATKPFTVRLEDRPVREAMAAALPVAKLHGRLGMLDLEEFGLLSDDRYVQTSRFSDGTRIIANLSDKPAEIDGVGMVSGHSWREAPG